MSELSISLYVNNIRMQVRPGTVVAAALLNAGIACRTSVSSEPRAALCGMGICFECRATIDGVPHQRTCQLTCRDGMQVETT